MHAQGERDLRCLLPHQLSTPCWGRSTPGFGRSHSTEEPVGNAVCGVAESELTEHAHSHVHTQK